MKNPPDLLVLRTLTRGALHGYGVAQRVKETAAGHKHLAAERKEFERIVAAIHLVLANA